MTMRQVLEKHSQTTESSGLESEDAGVVRGSRDESAGDEGARASAKSEAAVPETVPIARWMRGQR